MVYINVKYKITIVKIEVKNYTTENQQILVIIYIK